MKIIITTSGLGTRLMHLTKDNNKSLLRIGNKFSICYIIEKFDPDTTEFIITLGYKGDLVKEFLIVTYDNYNFTFINIDNYDKEGSSLLYSLLQCESYLQSPFMFFCCDSIILDTIDFNNFKNYNKNYLLVSKYDNSLNYSSVNVNDKNEIIKINDKNANIYDYVYTGVSYIYDFNNFWNESNKIYLNDNKNKNLSDVNVYSQLLLNNIKFKYVVLNNWYDSGNIESLSIVNKIIKCDYDILDKEYESICFTNNRVIKYTQNKDENFNKILRGIKLYPNAPKIFETGNNFYSMEYINGILLSKSYKHGHIYNLLNWAKKNLWINEKKEDKYIDICEKFYKNKTTERINELKLKFNFKEYNSINNIQILSIDKLLDKIDWNSLYTNIFYNFHGDFILDNIIYTNYNEYKLLDWRQDFGGELLHGDMYYDLAKLRHNIIFNHENISNNLFLIIEEKENINIDLKCNYFLIQQLEDFDKFIIENKLDVNKIKILCSLIWLNMSPLHEYNISKFLFNFGKYNLHLLLS